MPEIGATSRTLLISQDDAAFTGRNAGHTVNAIGITRTGEGLDSEGEERIRQAYGAEKYDRLKALKRKYDAGNLFRLNQNIPPD